MTSSSLVAAWSERPARTNSPATVTRSPSSTATTWVAPPTPVPGSFPRRRTAERVPSFLDLADLAGEHYRGLVARARRARCTRSSLRRVRRAARGVPRRRRRGFRGQHQRRPRASSRGARTRYRRRRACPVSAARSDPPARCSTRAVPASTGAPWLPRSSSPHGRSAPTGERRPRRSSRTATASTVETPTATISAGAVVVAGGAWTTELARSFGMRTGVRPVRGQIVHLHLDADTGSWPVLQPIRSHYVVPFRAGRLALGATVEDVGFDVRPTASGLGQLFSEGLRLESRSRRRDVPRGARRPATRERRRSADHRRARRRRERVRRERVMVRTDCCSDR